MSDWIYSATVFIEGMASFLSPCVLPMVPLYMTYMTGSSAEALIENPKAHRSLIYNSLAFIFGFSVIFVLMGAAATQIGSYLLRNQHLFRRISGLLIALFGLYHIGLLPLKFLNYEKRLRFLPESPGFFPSMLIGMGFSIGWTPCIGPLLTSVLIMAANAKTAGTGMLLLGVYALGMGLPFLLLSLGLRYLWRYFEGILRHIRIIKIISGIILIIAGIMVYFNTFYFLAY